jgi:hypothetical protein
MRLNQHCPFQHNIPLIQDIWPSEYFNASYQDLKSAPVRMVTNLEKKEPAGAREYTFRQKLTN